MHRNETQVLPSLSHVTLSAVSEDYSELLGFPISAPFPLSTSVLNQGPFPPPALHRLHRILRASPPSPRARSVRHRLPVGRHSRPREGTSRVASVSPRVHAIVITPAEWLDARFAHFSSHDSLPRFTGGSASALPISRPAQRSLALRPAHLLSHLK